MNTTNKRDGLNELTNKLRQMNGKPNIIINEQDETLEEAAKKYSPARAGVNSYPEKKAFIAGANWQKEQNKVIIDKLIEVLKNSHFYIETAINAIHAGGVKNSLIEGKDLILSEMKKWE